MYNNNIFTIHVVWILICLESYGLVQSHAISFSSTSGVGRFFRRISKQRSWSFFQQSMRWLAVPSANKERIRDSFSKHTKIPRHNSTFHQKKNSNVKHSRCFIGIMRHLRRIKSGTCHFWLPFGQKARIMEIIVTIKGGPLCCPFACL